MLLLLFEDVSGDAMCGDIVAVVTFGGGENDVVAHGVVGDAVVVVGSGGGVGGGGVRHEGCLKRWE